MDSWQITVEKNPAGFQDEDGVLWLYRACVDTALSVYGYGESQRDVLMDLMERLSDLPHESEW